MKKLLQNIVKLKDINNKRFPVRDISVNFRFGFEVRVTLFTDHRFRHVSFIDNNLNTHA